MPSVSKAQQRLMCGICNRSITGNTKIDRQTACDYCHSTEKVSALPERKGR